MRRLRDSRSLHRQRPAWLDHAHRALDEAVAAAYAWPANLPDEEILRRLLALNRERAGGSFEANLPVPLEKGDLISTKAG